MRRLALMLSGGADSTYLLTRYAGKLVAIHVHLPFHPRLATRNATYLCRLLGVPLVHLDGRGFSYKRWIEQAAHSSESLMGKVCWECQSGMQRLAVTWCKEHGVPRVLVGYSESQPGPSRSLIDGTELVCLFKEWPVSRREIELVARQWLGRVRSNSLLTNCSLMWAMVEWDLKHGRNNPLVNWSQREIRQSTAFRVGMHVLCWLAKKGVLRLVPSVRRASQLLPRRCRR